MAVEAIPKAALESWVEGAGGVENSVGREWVNCVPMVRLHASSPPT